MAEYIDRESLKKRLPDLKGGLQGLICDTVREILDSEPTVDVAKTVEHGQWIQQRIIRYNGDKPYTQFAHNCSRCKWLNKHKKGWNTNYCPNCGAKMKEK